MKTWTAALVMMTVAAFGAARENKLPADAEAALQHGSSFVLYSLLPELAPGIGFDDDIFAPPEKKKKNDASKPALERLHDFPILGRTELVNPADRNTAVTSMLASMKAWNGVFAPCFHPRHALRVTHQGVVFDFVICFECFTIKLYRGGEPHGHVNVFGRPDKLDQILKKGGVPLPEPAPSKP
ncbi:MAG: hypothetical protein Q8M07_17630 [Prosthecobacter sp.]|nr:hypothetical protein [Prosthecobacter sp.]